jgi:uncharacterized protein
MLPTVQWLRTHRKLGVALPLLAMFGLLNGLAYWHAYTMTHFVRDGGPKATPGERPHPEGMNFAHKLGVLLGGVTLCRPTNDATPASVGLAYETYTFPSEVGALEAWYVPHADARGLVLLFHGYGGCKSELLPEVKGFNDLGYSCFLIDFPGSGGSDGDSTTIGWREADDVANTLEYVRAKWPGERLILFGQSMGAAATLRAMATRGVKADATVLECPFDTLLHTVEMRFQAMGLPAFPGAELLVFWGGLQFGFNGFALNPVEYAKSATGPVLMLHGAEDARVTQGQLRSIYDNLPSEKALHFFEGLGHESYVSRRPVEWKDWVGRFLEKVRDQK